MKKLLIFALMVGMIFVGMALANIDTQPNSVRADEEKNFVITSAEGRDSFSMYIVHDKEHDVDYIIAQDNRWKKGGISITERIKEGE